MAGEWRTLEPGDFNRRVGAAGTDPMWVWADATAYRDLGGLPAQDPPSLWCVVERDDSFHTQRLDAKAAAAAEAHAIELAMPVVPQRMPPASPPVDTVPEGQVTTSTRSQVLVGVIDSGCPFAAPMLRDASGHGTRVLGLWDQDESPAFAGKGFRPPGMQYGRAIDREGLNGYLSAATRSGGWVDEDRCYAAAGYTAVRSRLSHGAAVLSQLFAAPLYGSALQPGPGKAPRWDDTDPAIDRADLVFVQLPRAGVQDSSSAALARYLLDGLRYIVSHAAEGQRVVVNISSGTSRTGHDGTSMIERLLHTVVSEAEAQKIDLQIVLPIGNTNLEQRHAVLSKPGSHLELFLPPDCETPQYVTVRWPPGVKGARLAVTPPGGTRQEIAAGQALGLFGPVGPCCGVISPPARSGNAAARSLLAFSATRSPAGDYPLAPSGRWRIELVTDDGQPLVDPVQFWVSRAQRNPGALPRARQADFVDWDRSHDPRPWLRRLENDTGQVADGIRRAGALSGLATAALDAKKVVVVGGVFSGTHEPSPYSAAAKPGTPLPEFSAPADNSRALRGLSVRGNHAGEVVRVVGTSFAAPLVARALVNKRLPKAGPAADGRRGRGVLIP